MKIYGGSKASYGVRERQDGWIELSVYHDNKEVRSVLQRHIDRPSELLELYGAYSGSTIRAKRWLAEVMHDYGTYFGQDSVQIILNPAAPPPSPPPPGAAPVAAPAAAPRPRSPLQGGSAVTPEEVCKAIHEALLARPLWVSPAQVTFGDGLYFFYEDGEVSQHGPQGRIVRVGNHPRSQGGLVNRLRMHYSGNKNSSVFRKFLGGALLRRANANDTCLSPAPGKGHWEKQDAKACPLCMPTEAQVSQLLRQRFTFRCVQNGDRDERNRLEGLLVATLAACGVCRPSSSWLGLCAYSEKVRESGLWNSQYVGDPTIDQSTLSRFLDLVSASP